ncbi:MAG TPA: hypothetical protein VJT83_02825 [Chitinophagaceae bacterium]|nr:hypothetical protein [Chitinophagaceae bacterium]
MHRLRNLPVWSKILLGFLLLIVVFLISASIFLDGMVDRQLKKMISNSNDQLYHFEYSKLRINLFTGNLTLYDLKITADSSLFIEFKKQHRAPRYLITGDAKFVKLKHLNWLTYLASKKISGSNLIIESPDIALTQFSNPSNEPDTPGRAGKIIAERLNGLSLDAFQIMNAAVRYKYIDSQLNPAVEYQFQNIDFKIEDLRLKRKGKLKEVSLSNYELSLNKYEFHSPDSMYVIQLNNFGYSLKDDAASLKSFIVKPRLAEKEYSKLKFQKERNELKVENVTCKGIDIISLVEKGVLKIKSAHVPSGSWDLYLNRIPKLPPPREDPVPVQKLKNLPFYIDIRELSVGKFQLRYKEYNPATEKDGILNFNDISGTFKNLTNIPNVISANPELKVSLYAKLMNIGKFNANFNFLLNDESGKFDVNASLGKMDAIQFNPGFIALNKLEITSGTVDTLFCSGSGNENGAAGDVNMLYHGLHVSVLAKDKNTNELKKKGFFSLIANIFVKNDNPKKKEPVRTAHNLRIKRGPERSFFNLLWMILFTGIGKIATGK